MAWTIAEFNTQVSFAHDFVVYTRLYNAGSFVAIDDLTILDFQCQLPINCDFENAHICSYTPFNDKTTSDYNFGLINSNF